jgi:hypothetical protein
MAERRELREISSLPVGGTDYSISVILSGDKKLICLCADLQRIVHVLKCLFGLLKEPKHDRPGELAVILLVIHL